MGYSSLDSEQLAELKEIFCKLDRDGDGSITELELCSLLRSLGLKPNGQQLEQLTQKADTNNNGLIEFQELVDLLSPVLTKSEAPYNEQQLQALFRAFDRDGNGFITAVELAHSMARLGHALTVKELTEMIREADTDNDGRISYPEFVAAMTSAAFETASSRVAASP